MNFLLSALVELSSSLNFVFSDSTSVFKPFLYSKAWIKPSVFLSIPFENAIKHSMATSLSCRVLTNLPFADVDKTKSFLMKISLNVLMLSSFILSTREKSVVTALIS
ncbi:hypothetical protein D3C78_1012220 [compost metagenome]